ncbi:MAG: hypothetical protein K0R36_869 [Chryseobacterium sp.]|jgi:hypothetical protein|nr:hypothetical protein [Chryseobacterium sp.]
MTELHLDLIFDKLQGPPREHMKVHNYWAAVGLDRYHKDSKAEFEFSIDGKSTKNIIAWDSNFSKATMKEDKDIANHGGVALAWFVMSVLMDYKYVEQSEIGDGVDYRFSKTEPNDDDLNFLNDEYHYVEISGILEENKSNTLINRIKSKHNQINKGSKNNKASSVIVTLFAKPTTVKEIHQ